MLEKLISVLVAILLPFNFLGGIVAGIWLAVLGDWGAIGYGLAFGIGGRFIISLAMLPGLLIVGPALLLYKRGHRRSFVTLTFVNALYMSLVLSGWCSLVLFFFLSRTHDSVGIPLLLWAYAAATGPISYLAQKDLQTGNEFAVISAFFSQLTFLAAAIFVLVASPSMGTIVVGFTVSMACGLLLQTALTVFQGQVTAPDHWD